MPFLLQKPRQSTTVIDNRDEDGSRESQHDEMELHPELHAASEELMSAMHSKDISAIGRALERVHKHMGDSHASETGEE